ncbi:hypothetical protein GCM10007904_23990 [Oharaeibacter diazotrophicus]|nr:hypothetical protein GCM10007904_23990 [Oharaeibacter diazotrophicus]
MLPTPWRGRVGERGRTGSGLPFRVSPGVADVGAGGPLSLSLPLQGGGDAVGVSGRALPSGAEARGTERV